MLAFCHFGRKLWKGGKPNPEIQTQRLSVVFAPEANAGLTEAQPQHPALASAWERQGGSIASWILPKYDCLFLNMDLSDFGFHLFARNVLISLKNRNWPLHGVKSF